MCVYLCVIGLNQTLVFHLWWAPFGNNDVYFQLFPKLQMLKEDENVGQDNTVAD